MATNIKKEKSSSNFPLSKIKLKSTEEVNEFAENIINTVREPLLLLDKELRVVKVSRSFYNFFKVNSGETIGKLIYDLGNHQWDIPKLRELLETILPEKTTFDNYEVEHDFSTIGKRIMLLNARQIERALGKEKIILLAIEDITKRKQAEETLRKSESQLHTLVQTIPDLIWLKDINGVYLSCNTMFERFFGAKETDIVGKTDYDFIDRELADFFLENDRKAMTAGKPTSNEEWITFEDDGHRAFLDTIKTPMYDSKGELVGILGIGRDITERKQAEESILADKLKTEFLAQMSHEIRTPINAIVVNVDYLNESFGNKMDSDARECFDSINLATKRIIRTVDLILNAADLQTSGYKLHLVTVDLNSEILNKLHKEHQLYVKLKGLEFIYTCKEKDTNVIADHYSIFQIFSNLIDNAVKYTIKGKVEIVLEKNKLGIVIVEVKDTGIGISKEYIPRIFEPFTQEDHGYTRSFEGNGIGLALVKKYCELNNIIVEVESEKNVGSTFRIIFNH
jgi:PAS domain S-box-containing protein